MSSLWFRPYSDSGYGKNQEAFRIRERGAARRAPDESPASLGAVYVVMTGQEATTSALHETARRSWQLSARVCLVVAVSVGYPAPLTSAWGQVDAATIRGRRLAERTGVPSELRVYLCRETVRAFSQNLPPNAIVLVGGARHWWRSREQRLANQLSASGLHALFVNTAEPSHA